MLIFLGLCFLGFVLDVGELCSFDTMIVFISNSISRFFFFFFFKEVKNNQTQVLREEIQLIFKFRSNKFFYGLYLYALFFSW